MPIDYSKYPPNWKELRQQVLDRAGNCCEGSPTYPDCRAENYWLHPVTGSDVILTIAHLDHDSDNMDVKIERLRAWCQRCHLKYDHKRHIDNRMYGRNHRKNNYTLDLK